MTLTCIHKFIPIHQSICLIFMLIVLTSCWDREEINDVALVLTSAVDLEDDGRYRVSYLIALPRQLAGTSQSGSSNNKPYYIDSEVASSMSQAMFQLQKRMPRHISLSHRRTIILGEQLAKQGIGFLFDFFPRYFENRLSTWLVVCQGKGYSILQASPQIERFPSEATRELLEVITSFPVDFRQVAVALQYDEDPVIPYIRVHEQQQGDETLSELKLEGYAQFKKEKMVGIFQEDEAFGLMWLLNQPSEYMFTLTNQNQSETTITLLEGELTVAPKYVHNKLNYHIYAKAKCRIRENHNLQDTFQLSNIHQLELSISSHIQKQIESTLKKMEKNQTDSSQLSLKTWRHNPKLEYSYIKSMWKDVLEKKAFTISVSTRIVDTGLIYKNIVE